MKKLGIAISCVIGFAAIAVGQNPPEPKRVEPADAKNHVGETVVVCGKVVDNNIGKYGIAGHGKPVLFDLDEPQPNPIFYFVAFATPPQEPNDIVNTYQGKRVCVTGKVASASTGPYIMATDRSQIKVDSSGK